MDKRVYRSLKEMRRIPIGFSSVNFLPRVAIHVSPNKKVQVSTNLSEEVILYKSFLTGFSCFLEGNT